MNTKVVRDLLGYQLAVFVAAPPAVVSCAPAWGATFAARLAELVRIANAEDDVSQPKRRKAGKGRAAKPEPMTPVGLHAVLLALCGSTVPADLPFYELFIQLLAVACTLPVWMRTLPAPPGARRPIVSSVSRLCHVPFPPSLPMPTAISESVWSSTMLAPIQRLHGPCPF
jgi:hypothetical protein